eukprot:Anaeramoba_ignava/a91685_65.p1 GENE.a91685_65~~a91685_65.p1  ORF type:complete len:452 (+),score=136.22 a91685_65:396-1751(+)
MQKQIQQLLQIQNQNLNQIKNEMENTFKNLNPIQMQMLMENQMQMLMQNQLQILMQNQIPNEILLTPQLPNEIPGLVGGPVPNLFPPPLIAPDNTTIQLTNESNNLNSEQYQQLTEKNGNAANPNLEQTENPQNIGMLPNNNMLFHPAFNPLYQPIYNPQFNALYPTMFNPNPNLTFPQIPNPTNLTDIANPTQNNPQNPFQNPFQHFAHQTQPIPIANHNLDHDSSDFDVEMSINDDDFDNQIHNDNQNQHNRNGNPKNDSFSFPQHKLYNNSRTKQNKGKNKRKAKSNKKTLDKDGFDNSDKNQSNDINNKNSKQPTRTVFAIYDHKNMGEIPHMDELMSFFQQIPKPTIPQRLTKIASLFPELIKGWNSEVFRLFSTTGETPKRVEIKNKVFWIMAIVASPKNQSAGFYRRKCYDARNSVSKFFRRSLKMTNQTAYVRGKLIYEKKSN